MPIRARPRWCRCTDCLPRLADTPVAVIQSTLDEYLPAVEARRLFGPDTSYRWLQPIQARNHSFGGARDEMYYAIQRSLAWIESLIPSREYAVVESAEAIVETSSDGSTGLARCDLKPASSARRRSAGRA